MRKRRHWRGLIAAGVCAAAMGACADDAPWGESVGADAASPASIAPTPSNAAEVGLFDASRDIGAVSAAGSSLVANGVYRVEGSGRDIWNRRDEFRFVYREFVGDVTITARVLEPGRSHPWSKAGIMIRGSAAPNARHKSAFATSDNGIVQHSRRDPGAQTENVFGPDASAPYWLRLVRRGSSVTALASGDGRSWSTIAEATIPLGRTALVGLAVTSHNDGAISAAEFDDVSVVGAAQTVPWRETFAGLAGQTRDDGDTAWTSFTPGADAFAVADGAFEARRSVPGSEWRSAPIELDGPVDVRLDLEGEGSLDRSGSFADSLVVSYQRDAGAEVTIASIAGRVTDESRRVSARIAGSGAITLIVRPSTTGGDEIYRWDNVTVTRATGSPAGGLDERPPNPTCVAPPRPQTPDAKAELEPAFGRLPALDRPLFMVQATTAGRPWFLIEQPGRVRRFTGDGRDATIALDIRGRVDDEKNEAGLLGIALAPDFAASGHVYLSYTGNRNGLESRLSRFTSRDGGRTIDASSEQILLRQPQFAGNHNGGWIGFGPDGLLYMALGDGGGAGDPRRQGQDPTTWLGAILRIDVSGGGGYSIPDDNPFVRGGGAPEVYAYGFRNPWRLSFDRDTGRLWAGDVGQGAIEEVDIVEAGGNYGWNIKEGSRCFGASSCDDAGLIDPVGEYDHDQGKSITGGFVYRGQDIPALVGAFVFGDFVSGKLWTLAPQGDGAYRQRVLIESTGRNIASFAEGLDGELYLLDLGGGIYRFAPAGAEPGSTLPQRLSETGCFDPADPRRPGPGLVPYDVNAPLWSDGADKERYFAIPDGTAIGIGAAGDLEFPRGTVLVKSFSINGTRVETRLFVRHPDGQWGGYTYHWNEQQTDARLLAADLRVEVEGQSWLIPSRSQCLQCHTAAAGRSLGLELGQLDRDQTYPSTGRTANQVETLAEAGFFGDALPATWPAIDDYRDPSRGAVTRARAYLHSNCSNCHRPGGPGRGGLDLRVSTAFRALGVCDELPDNGDLGIANARVVAPGAPGRSVLLQRMQRLDASRMPPLATEIIDTLGTSVIRDWIRGLGGCP